MKEDKVTREQVDKLDEWTREQVDCEGRQSNREQGVSTYNIWGEKGLKKARDKYTSYKKSLVFICCHF